MHLRREDAAQEEREEERARRGRGAEASGDDARAEQDARAHPEEDDRRHRQRLGEPPPEREARRRGEHGREHPRHLAGGRLARRRRGRARSRRRGNRPRAERASEASGDRAADLVRHERDHELDLESREHAEIVRVSRARPVLDEARQQRADDHRECPGERTAPRREEAGPGR